MADDRGSTVHPLTEPTDPAESAPSCAFETRGEASGPLRTPWPHSLITKSCSSEGGHVPFLEDTETFVAALRCFVAEHSVRSLGQKIPPEFALSSVLVMSMRNIDAKSSARSSGSQASVKCTP